MDRDDVPDWKDMPRDTPIATLCWQDIYIFASDELGRNPTQEEVRELFEETDYTLSKVVGDSFSEDLMDVMSQVVFGMLKEKRYNADTMSDAEFACKKYCHECKLVCETYWEINYCSKNPQGIDIPKTEHGNDNTCEDGYCNPESMMVELENLTTPYIKEHAVYERCVKCHQYFDSATVQ